MKKLILFALLLSAVCTIITTQGREMFTPQAYFGKWEKRTLLGGGSPRPDIPEHFHGHVVFGKLNTRDTHRVGNRITINRTLEYRVRFNCLEG